MKNSFDWKDSIEYITYKTQIYRVEIIIALFYIKLTIVLTSV